MKNLLFPASVVILTTLAATPVIAQQRGTIPNVITPPGSVSLSAPATSPLQQQMQDDYATQLRGAQQQLMQQNPSGLTRPELGINHTLNGFTPQ
jgi:hypothetical protein